MKKLFPFDRYHFKSEHLFEGLPDDVLKILYKNRVVKSFKKGNIVFSEGNYSSGIYHVDSGLIKKYTLGHEGKEHIFYLCKQGEFLGHHALLSGETYPDSTAAVLDSEISIIPKSDFLQAIDQSHTLSKRLLSSLSHEFGVFIHSTQILAQHPVRERTALALLILNEKFSANEEDQGKVIINISRMDFSNMVGTAHETVARILHDFKEDGLISTKGRKIKIIDRKELVKVSNYQF